MSKKVMQKIVSIEKPTELSAEKIELALVDDAKRVISDYASIEEDNAFGFVVKAEMEYKDVLSKYERLLKDIESITPKLEKAIQDIGINRSNFGVLEDLDDRKADVKERISIVKRNINDLKSINPS